MTGIAAPPAVPDFSGVYIGHARTPWSAGDCPKNMREARERGQPARLEIATAFRPALAGLERASHLILLGWFDLARRDRLVQQPKHLAGPEGVFALRSPDRPNPIGLSIVRLVALDIAAGVVAIDALDWYEATPLLDLKPYYPSVDLVPGATIAERRRPSG